MVNAGAWVQTVHILGGSVERGDLTPDREAVSRARTDAAG